MSEHDVFTKGRHRCATPYLHVHDLARHVYIAVPLSLATCLDIVVAGEDTLSDERMCSGYMQRAGRPMVGVGKNRVKGRERFKVTSSTRESV